MQQLNTSIECVLFDLDGTLIDTAADFQKALDDMLENQGRPLVASHLLRQTVSNGARALVTLAFEIEENDQDFEQHLQQLLDLYYEQLKTTLATPYPGILELLDQLEAADIRWGVVTNKPEKYSRLLLENLNLLHRCQVLICPEQVSEKKPHPEPLLLACEKLSCSVERTVYVGDHIRDMQAAKNAEIIAIAAQYGYLEADAKIDEWNADFIIAAASDTAKLLSILKFA